MTPLILNLFTTFTISFTVLPHTPPNSGPHLHICIVSFSPVPTDAHVALYIHVS